MDHKKTTGLCILLMVISVLGLICCKISIKSKCEYQYQIDAIEHRLNGDVFVYGVLTNDMNVVNLIGEVQLSDMAKQLSDDMIKDKLYIKGTVNQLFNGRVRDEIFTVEIKSSDAGKVVECVTSE